MDTGLPRKMRPGDNCRDDDSEEGTSGP